MHLKIKLTEYQVYSLIGMAGISPHEKRYAQRWGRFFMLMMLLTAILLLLEWQWVLLDQITFVERLVINWAVWSLFVFTFVVQLLVVKNKKRYFKQNWFLPVVIVMGLPFLFGVTEYIDFFDGLRPILAIVILTPSFHTLFKFLIDGQLRTTLLAAFVIIVIFGLLIAGFDANIKTPWDGIWWALVTMSTVGYGDVVPSSALGRIIGAGMIIIGVALFVIITGNILAVILRKDTRALHEEEREVSKMSGEINHIKANQEEALRMIKNLSKQVESLKAEKSKGDERKNE